MIGLDSLLKKCTNVKLNYPNLLQNFQVLFIIVNNQKMEMVRVKHEDVQDEHNFLKDSDSTIETVSFIKTASFFKISNIIG